LLRRHRDSTRNSVRNVVMCTTGMINAVPAATRRSPLKTDKLVKHPVVVKQIDPAAVHERKEIEIEVALALAGS
jgi:hypothetical protein